MHVVFAALDDGEADPALLSEEERARAARFLVEPPRRQYVAARAILRRLLAAFLGVPAAELRFAYGAHGKPLMSEGDGALRFNLSHVGRAALYVFALDREVGVDLESLTRQPDAVAIARSVFTARERAEIEALAPDTVAERFLTIWTRKEAYGKALGLGLALPFSRVDVSTGRAVPEAGAGDPAEASRWGMADLRIEGHVGAVVAEGTEWRLRPWRWPGAAGQPAS